MAIDIHHTLRVAKKRLLEMHYRSKVGHLGGNLSALDAMMVLHHQIMSPQDMFILSKGHAAGALYITLWSLGRLSDSDLKTFHENGTTLAGHPVVGWLPEIPIATGSLGHGLPVSIGIALGRSLSNQPGHVFCLTSDGEWQEGSNWEALIFLAHRKLTNITVLIDVNGLQGFGTTDEVASMSALYNKLASFGLNIIQIDGHNPAIIKAAIEANPGGILLLNTKKGAGISFMENRMEWHYLSLNENQFNQAITEIDHSEK